MSYIEVNGEQLYYAEARSPDARLTMVLVHGAGENHLIWPASLRRMDEATIYALDLPGHGKSGGKGCASIGDYTAVLLGFLEALDINCAVIAGHSMGGAIAQQFALSHPTRVKGLILVATGARLRVLPAILDGILTDTDATLDLVTRYAWGANAPQQMVQLGRTQMAEADPHVVANDYAACNAFDVMDRVGQIAVPTLALGGTVDQMTPPKYLAYLAEKIPGARLAMIEGAGHMVMLEQPDLVAQHIGQFLTAIA
jgi:pimeloyl-ACP methyl ester carboxylesterase